jgi:hypothetical protein
MVQEESTVIPERATDPLTGKESFIFRMADEQDGTNSKGSNHLIAGSIDRMPPICYANGKAQTAIRARLRGPFPRR